MKCFQKEKQERFIDVAILVTTSSELSFSFNKILKDSELRMLSIHALLLQLLFVQTGIKYSIMCLESDFVFVISNFSFIMKTSYGRLKKKKRYPYVKKV